MSKIKIDERAGCETKEVVAEKFLRKGRLDEQMNYDLQRITHNDVPKSIHEAEDPPPPPQKVHRQRHTPTRKQRDISEEFEEDASMQWTDYALAIFNPQAFARKRDAQRYIAAIKQADLVAARISNDIARAEEVQTQRHALTKKVIAQIYERWGHLMDPDSLSTGIMNLENRDPEFQSLRREALQCILIDQRMTRVIETLNNKRMPLTEASLTLRGRLYVTHGQDEYTKTLHMVADATGGSSQIIHRDMADVERAFAKIQISAERDRGLMDTLNSYAYDQESQDVTALANEAFMTQMHRCITALPTAPRDTPRTVKTSTKPMALHS